MEALHLHLRLLQFHLHLRLLQFHLGLHLLQFLLSGMSLWSPGFLTWLLEILPLTSTSSRRPAKTITCWFANKSFAQVV